MASTDTTAAAGENELDALLDEIDECESALTAWADYSPDPGLRGASADVREELEGLRAVITKMRPDPDPGRDAD